MTFNAPWKPFMAHTGWRVIEWALLFIFIPVLLLGAPRMILFGLLWGAAFLAVVWLYRQDKRIVQWGAQRHEWTHALLRAAVVAAFLFVSAFLLLPDRFLSLPLERPVLWVTIIILYPILSALPQEFIYRAFMQKRYAFLNAEGPFVIASAFAFALAHLMFGNVIALLLGFVGGLVFARTYWRTKSFGLVLFEHALYGILIFTSGWGWYFYLGAGHSFGDIMIPPSVTPVPEAVM